MAKAVFLDRDETLNPDPGYISDPSDFTLFPWVPELLKKLKDAGFLLIVVSNQSGVGRGLITPESLAAIHGKLNRLLSEAVGILIDDFSICPHRPDESCSCRKPKPELILRAAQKHHIQIHTSFLIGDRKSDFEAGIAAGVRESFLIQPGDEASFKMAVERILKTETN